MGSVGNLRDRHHASSPASEYEGILIKETSQKRRFTDSQWFFKPVTRIQALTLAVLVTLCVALLFDKETKNAHQSCEIQARGLPASHALSRVEYDIYILLSLPEPNSVKVPPFVKNTLKDLTKNAHIYFTLEGSQPIHRTC